MRMDLEMKNTSNSDCTHCTIVVSLEMSDEPYYVSSSSTERLPTGDLNGDSEVNATDAVLLIDKYIMGE